MVDNPNHPDDPKKKSANDAHEAELTALRQRVAELEEQLAASVPKEEAEQARRSEKHAHRAWKILRLLADAIPGYIFVKDSSYRYLLANKNIADGLGRTPESMVGKDDWEVGFPEELILGNPEKGIRGFRVDDQDVIEGQQTIHNPYDPANFEDGIHVFDTLKQPLYDLDGTIFGVLGVARDITQQQEAEEAQRRLERSLQEANAELEQRVAERTKELRLFKTLVENTPDGISISNHDSIFVYANAAFRTMLGYDDLVGYTLEHIIPEHQKLQQIFDEMLVEGSWSGNLRYQRKDGSDFMGQITAFLNRDDQGNIIGSMAIARDITQQLEEEEERAALQEQVIDAQRSAIRELSTPLIPLSDSVVLMPLIGTIDSQRAQMVIEVLLEGVAEYQAEIAIVDITGVRVVDTQVANTLMQAAQAIKLLGSKTILTGIGPTMAQTLVHLGTDLSTLTTKGSLQAGIAEALVKKGERTVL